MNAIILGAGMGTRLRPITNDIPKCLVSVNGTPMIERQIEYLFCKKINDITIISGYKAEKLEYLKYKYGVSIRHNNKYDACNNIYSLYLAQDLLDDTYIIEGDVYMHKNCFLNNLHISSYFSKWVDNYKNEWGLKIDENYYLKDIVVGDGTGYIMSGISFWTKNHSALIKKHLSKVIALNQYKTLFWDHIIIDIQKEMSIKVLPCSDVYEIDTEAELNDLEASLY